MPYSLLQTFYTLVKNSSLKSKLLSLRFLNAFVKICQIHVIFQITSQFSFKFYDSSVSPKVTFLYFFTSKVIYFAREGPVKVQILETFECSDQNLPKSCHFLNNKSVFLQILHQSSVSWDITPLYFFSFNFLYFQKKEPIKVQIWWNFTWAIFSEILHFDGILL